MATKGGGSGRGEGGAKELAAQISKTLKEGEKLLAPTRRPDGTLRKPIRIRAGFVPQDEVAVYKSKGSKLKEETVPPGYDPEQDVVTKPKSKSAKRNERKKEKRLQGKNEASSTGDEEQALESVESIASHINEITISGNPCVPTTTPPSTSMESSATTEHVPDIDKRIRALKKKIRLMEAQQQKAGHDHDLKQEQVEKAAKLEDWRRELKLLQETSQGSL
ncbi:partner of Y14 and mago isoform X2 [Lactuca sativa]|uniref:WIBG Mago-binding domain-containing protein n=1 Tax=Lactuca sativa TaxID=4236 RepID=A0A9R1UZX5_LACSA|nr:partner of Y14 and mago isoform X2 [Lactuca sativa]KAJ0197105.1 hypothetical protein LSAT_V11C700372720 [Lactuca sativa]